MAPISWEKAGHLWSAHVAQESLTAWASAGHTLYAVLDACDEPTVLHIVAELGNQAASLYHGKAAQDYASFAPYLACVNDATLQTIQSQLAARPWGFLAGTTADISLADVRRHFRQYLMVQSPDGKELYFRFYDPRFLPTFMQALDEQELQNFLGPLKFIMTIEENAPPTAYTNIHSHPSLQTLQLLPPLTISNPQA